MASKPSPNSKPTATFRQLLAKPTNQELATLSRLPMTAKPLTKPNTSITEPSLWDLNDRPNLNGTTGKTQGERIVNNPPPTTSTQVFDR